jgi:hypothetical protein
MNSSGSREVRWAPLLLGLLSVSLGSARARLLGLLSLGVADFGLIPLTAGVIGLAISFRAGIWTAPRPVEGGEDP